MTTERGPEYAIAGSYVEFIRWVGEDRTVRARVTFLSTPERAAGRAPGVLHRIGTWETSPAREAAEGLHSLRETPALRWAVVSPAEAGGYHAWSEPE